MIKEKCYATKYALKKSLQVPSILYFPSTSQSNLRGDNEQKVVFLFFYIVLLFSLSLYSN